MCEETGDWPLDIDDLLRFSFQVAQGLDFLAAKNVSDLITKKDLNAQTSKKETISGIIKQKLLCCPETSGITKQNPHWNSKK